MSDFNIYDWKRESSMQTLANFVIGILHELAQATDLEYSYECADSGNTNTDPVGERQEFVRLLHEASLAINGSGFCDCGFWEPIYGLIERPEHLKIV
jgi:hypothetical protein